MRRTSRSCGLSWGVRGGTAVWYSRIANRESRKAGRVTTSAYSKRKATQEGALSRPRGAESAPSEPPPERTADRDGRASDGRRQSQSRGASQDRHPSGLRTREDASRSTKFRAAAERARRERVPDARAEAISDRREPPHPAITRVGSPLPWLSLTPSLSLSEGEGMDPNGRIRSRPLSREPE